MENEKIKIIYEDDKLLIIDKPAGLIVFPEGETKEKTLIDLLLEDLPELKNAGTAPRYGIVHRLDKDTSGVLLVAKNNEALESFQKQFKEGLIKKRYIALVVGNLKNDEGTIETLIGRSPQDRRKQKVYLENDPASEGKRKAVTKYKLLQRFENYDLIEIEPRSGRKHQIRTHLSYLGHPIAGDKLYGFKNQPLPKDLKRQFLHASYLKTDDGKEFESELPEDLKQALNNIK
jgi:23S rRNA pseudouridine1911/1915/1917 synthase